VPASMSQVGYSSWVLRERVLDPQVYQGHQNKHQVLVAAAAAPPAAAVRPAVAVGLAVGGPPVVSQGPVAAPQIMIAAVAATVTRSAASWVGGAPHHQPR
jgi:hypothetical protein